MEKFIREIGQLHEKSVNAQNDFRFFKKAHAVTRNAVLRELKRNGFGLRDRLTARKLLGIGGYNRKGAAIAGTAKAYLMGVEMAKKRKMHLFLPLKEALERIVRETRRRNLRSPVAINPAINMLYAIDNAQAVYLQRFARNVREEVEQSALSRRQKKAILEFLEGKR